MVTNGTMTLQGVTDPELVKILEIKIKHESTFFFNPAGIQPTNTPQNKPGAYNNVNFSWNAQEGLEATFEVIKMLLGKT